MIFQNSQPILPPINKRRGLTLCAQNFFRQNCKIQSSQYLKVNNENSGLILGQN